MTHEPSCIAETDRINALIVAFDQRYPDHCRDCGGLGASEWSDPDVGIFSALDPCMTCEGATEGATCGLCGKPGDFSGRTLSLDADDMRPCGCPVEEQRPHQDGPCACIYGLEYPSGTEVEDLDQDGLPPDAEDEGEYDFPADDFAYDAWREQAATRMFRGRD